MRGWKRGDEEEEHLHPLEERLEEDTFITKKKNTFNRCADRAPTHPSFAKVASTQPP